MEADDYLQQFVEGVMAKQPIMEREVPIKSPSAIRASLRSNVLESTATPKQLSQS